MYKKLKYSINDGQPFPVGLNYEHELQNMASGFKSTGLTQQQVAERANIYGKNEHIVNPPTYF